MPGCSRCVDTARSPRLVVELARDQVDIAPRLQHIVLKGSRYVVEITAAFYSVENQELTPA